MPTTAPAGKTIYLLRHAKSSWKDSSLEDRERPLNKRGRVARDIMAKYFGSETIRPDIVLCSPAERARSTVTPILAAIGETATIRYEDGIYGASPAAILEILCELDDAAASVLVVGHSPGIDELALCLSADDDGELRSRMIAKFPTCALAILAAPVARWRDLNVGSARLEGFIRPRDLADH